MKSFLALPLLLLAGACALPKAADTCADPRALADAIVKLDRAQGTAIFTKANEMVTVEHVSDSLSMSEAWQDIDISQKLVGPEDSWVSKHALMRVKRIIAAGLPEPLHVLEMQTPLSRPIRTVRLRSKPLSPSERVVAIGYSEGKQTFATGRFVTSDAPQYSLEGYLGFDFGTAENKYPLQKGVSGGAIFDCDGKVVGVMARGWDRNETRKRNATNYAVPVNSVAHMFSK